MNLRSSRAQNMGTSAYNMSQEYYEEGEGGQISTTATGTPAVTTAGLQTFDWDGFYTSNEGAALSESGFPAMYPSPNSTTGDTPSQQYAEDSATSQPGAPVKRRRENRYKNAPPAVLSRRRAQNRASQRAYRERKEQRIRELEVLLDESQRKQDNLSQAYLALQAEHEKLQADRGLSPQPGMPHAQLPHQHADPAMGMDFAHGAYGFGVPMSQTPTSGEMMGSMYVPNPLPSLRHHAHHEHHLPEYPPPSR